MKKFSYYVFVCFMTFLIAGSLYAVFTLYFCYFPFNRLRNTVVYPGVIFLFIGLVHIVEKILVKNNIIEKPKNNLLYFCVMLPWMLLCLFFFLSTE